MGLPFGLHVLFHFDSWSSERILKMFEAVRADLSIPANFCESETVELRKVALSERVKKLS